MVGAAAVGEARLARGAALLAAPRHAALQGPRGRRRRARRRGPAHQLAEDARRLDPARGHGGARRNAARDGAARGPRGGGRRLRRGARPRRVRRRRQARADDVLRHARGDELRRMGGPRPGAAATVVARAGRVAAPQGARPGGARRVPRVPRGRRRYS